MTELLFLMSELCQWLLITILLVSMCKQPDFSEFDPDDMSWMLRKTGNRVDK